jgi:hypothetical protein
MYLTHAYCSDFNTGLISLREKDENYFLLL